MNHDPRGPRCSLVLTWLALTWFALGSLSACGGAPSIAGRWVSDAQQTAAAMQEFIPPGAKARLAQEGDAQWSVTFAFDGDGKFRRTMALPILTKRESGTWSQSGQTVTMTITHRDDRPLPQPKVESATVEGTTLRYGPDNGPTFVLERKPN